jgi:hypothetical protein
MNDPTFPMRGLPEAPLMGDDEDLTSDEDIDIDDEDLIDEDLDGDLASDDGEAFDDMEEEGGA